MVKRADENDLNRTTAFSYIQSAAILSKVIFVPIGGALSEINPWLPMFLSSGFMILSLFVLLIFVPETLGYDDGSLEAEPETSALLSQGGEDVENDAVDNTATKDSIKLQLLEQVANLKVIFSHWTVQSPRVGFLMLCFFLVFLGETTFSTLILQFTEKRLGWSLGQVCISSFAHHFDPTNTTTTLFSSSGSKLSPPD